MRDLAPNSVELTFLSEGYPKLLHHVIDTGDLIDSRIGKTSELRDFRLHLTAPEYCVVGRVGMSLSFMYEEITQLLAGVYDGERLARYVPRAAELITPTTAYGPRVYPQLLRVENELRVAPNSRRAVVYVGRHDDLDLSDDPDRALEMPCTCLWQFQARDGALHMSVYMRSWDLVWGLSYDVPSFVAVQLALARSLGLRVGTYTHTSGNAHVYERHFDLETWPVPPTQGMLYLDHLLRETIAETYITALTTLAGP